MGDKPRSASGAAALEAFNRARSAGDVEAMATAALAIAARQQFGVDPGRSPAFLYTAFESAPAGPTKVRLAAALARAWGYGGDPQRAEGFAATALREAERLGNRNLLADALDAALVVRWGPDDAAERRRNGARPHRQPTAGSTRNGGCKG